MRDYILPRLAHIAHVCARPHSQQSLYFIVIYIIYIVRYKILHGHGQHNRGQLAKISRRGSAWVLILCSHLAIPWWWLWSGAGLRVPCIPPYIICHLEYRAGLEVQGTDEVFGTMMTCNFWFKSGPDCRCKCTSLSKAYILAALFLVSLFKLWSANRHK